MIINQKTYWKFVVRICINGLSKCFHNIGIWSDIWYAIQDNFLLCLYPPECDVIFWSDLIWYPRPFSDFTCDTAISPPHPSPMATYTHTHTTPHHITPHHTTPHHTHTVDLFICTGNFLWYEIYTSSFLVLILVIPSSKTLWLMPTIHSLLRQGNDYCRVALYIKNEKIPFFGETCDNH